MSQKTTRARFRADSSALFQSLIGDLRPFVGERRGRLAYCPTKSLAVAALPINDHLDPSINRSETISFFVGFLERTFRRSQRP